MAQKTLTLNLSDELYERIKEEAEASERPVEAVALETLGAAFYPSGEPHELSVDEMLKEMPHYSDSQLWTMVQRRLSWMQSLRLRELSARGQQGLLTSAEEDEMNALLKLVDEQMLLRAEAVLLLKERGQDVESRLMLGA